MIELVLGEFGSVLLKGQRVIPRRLLDAGFALDKDLIEFSLFDSKVSHDAAWLTGRN